MPDQQKFTAKLANTRCLVIGGSSGIGFAVAEGLLESGATVVVASSKTSRVADAVSRLQSAYPSKRSLVSGHVCDISDRNTLDANVKALFDAATENNTKKLNHVVHTAGDTPKLSDDMFNATFDSLTQTGLVRFYSVFFVAKHIREYIIPGVASSFTFTTGAVSERPMPGMPFKAAYAAAGNGAVRGLALELKPMRVNLVSLGAVETELWTGWFTQEQKEVLLKQLADKLPTGRVAAPEDPAEAYLYAIKDPSCTGSIISSDSGHLLVG